MNSKLLDMGFVKGPRGIGGRVWWHDPQGKEHFIGGSLMYSAMLQLTEEPLEDIPRLLALLETDDYYYILKRTRETVSARHLRGAGTSVLLWRLANE